MVEGADIESSNVTLSDNPTVVLSEALARKDGEDIMLDIYDNVQEEVKVKNNLLQKVHRKVYSHLNNTSLPESQL